MKTDNQLIREIKRKQNREAADCLIERYYKEIYAFTYRQTGDVEVAMDLTQEIFISVLQGIYSFDEKKAKFRTWIYRVAANKITDFYRSLARRKQALEVTYDVEIFDESSIYGVEDSLDILMRKETIQMVMDVVVKFKPDWVVIFQKKCFEGLTFVEIAKELGLSENTVKTRFYSMIKKVKQEVSFYD